MKKLYLVYLYFVLITGIFIYLNPPFESPDEQLHLDYVNYICKYGGLPNQLADFNDSSRFVGQGHQPPLYYILLSCLNLTFNKGDNINYALYVNKDIIYGGGNRNDVPKYDKSTNLKDSDSILMFYIFRIVSLILGLVSLAYIHKISELVISDDSVRILPVIFTASLPQFIFISSSINNDNLAILLSIIVFYYIYKSTANTETSRYWVTAGIFMGIGILTKKTLLFFVPGIIILAVLQAHFSSNLKQHIRNVTYFMLSALIISSPLLIRNVILYGELFGNKMEILTMPQFVDYKNPLIPGFWHYFIKIFFPQMLFSFIAVFGWMNVYLNVYFAGIKISSVIYWGYTILIISSLTHNVKTAVKQRNAVSFIPVLFFASCLISVIYFNFNFTQYQGRYLFPVISVIALMISQFAEKISGKMTDKVKKLFLILLVVFFLISDVFSLISLYNFYN